MKTIKGNFVKLLFLMKLHPDTNPNPHFKDTDLADLNEMVSQNLIEHDETLGYRITEFGGKTMKNIQQPFNEALTLAKDLGLDTK